MSRITLRTTEMMPSRASPLPQSLVPNPPYYRPFGSISVCRDRLMTTQSSLSQRLENQGRFSVPDGGEHVLTEKSQNSLKSWSHRSRKKWSENVCMD